MARNIRDLLMLALVGYSTLSFGADVLTSDVKKNIDKASSIISSAAKRISSAKSLNVAAVWEDNDEVKEVRAFSTAKRSATIYNVISELDKIEPTLFNKLDSNQFHLTASIFTRLVTLSYLEKLLPSLGSSGIVDSEIVLVDYIVGEIADLKLVTSGKIPYATYKKLRSNRNDKRSMLSMLDKSFVEELITMDVKKDSLARQLAHKTIMTSFFQICTSNLDTLCVKL